ncbi:hypothetical protein CHS0354_036293 [Potamilus streckersoni]|uniref:Uncharacterized protein n=1 Tax=Potamilus streckersoni TaxID=2493646 RepID=A0AAE0W8H4_9BIVA|nr:hypothetical protein CHS0354_036293 [Potamilus streckersoni]
MSNIPFQDRPSDAEIIAALDNRGIGLKPCIMQGRAQSFYTRKKQQEKLITEGNITIKNVVVPVTTAPATTRLAEMKLIDIIVFRFPYEIPLVASKEGLEVTLRIPTYGIKRDTYKAWPNLESGRIVIQIDKKHFTEIPEFFKVKGFVIQTWFYNCHMVRPCSQCNQTGHKKTECGKIQKAKATIEDQVIGHISDYNSSDPNNSELEVEEDDFPPPPMQTQVQQPQGPKQTANLETPQPPTKYYNQNKARNQQTTMTPQTSTNKYNNHNKARKQKTANPEMLRRKYANTDSNSDKDSEVEMETEPIPTTERQRKTNKTSELSQLKDNQEAGDTSNKKDKEIPQEDDSGKYIIPTLDTKQQNTNKPKPDNPEPDPEQKPIQSNLTMLFNEKDTRNDTLTQQTNNDTQQTTQQSTQQPNNNTQQH